LHNGRNVPRAAGIFNQISITGLSGVRRRRRIFLFQASVPFSWPVLHPLTAQHFAKAGVIGQNIFHAVLHRGRI
jgi:hypothetical protein